MLYKKKNSINNKNFLLDVLMHKINKIRVDKFKKIEWILTKMMNKIIFKCQKLNKIKILNLMKKLKLFSKLKN